MFRKIYFTIFTCVLFQAGFSQTNIPLYGIITKDQAELKECSFDKTAEAIVFFDVVEARPIDNKLYMHRRVRFKILKESALERANVHIPFYGADEFEVLTNVKGYVYSADPETGASSIKELDRSGIFREKVNKVWSELKLAMPNARVGSIIEYEYESTMQHWGGLRDWSFQTDIPTVLSRYDLTILPTAEFAYSITKKSGQPIDIKNIQEEGRIIFEMKNIAGLRNEPFSDAPQEYIQRVNFQLSKYQNSIGNNTRYSDTWQQLARDLINDDMFGRPIEKNISGTSEFLAPIKAMTSNLEKMNAIYSYVRKNFSTDGFRSIYASDGLKKVWDKKTGNTGELNLLLLNLLKEVKLDVIPLLVCDRQEGKVKVNYPFREQFHKVVSLVTIDGKKYILDATDKYTPVGTIPFGIVNTNVFAVVWKNAEPPSLIKDDSKKIRSSVAANIKIDEKGQVTGEISRRYFDYAKIAHVQVLQGADKEVYKKKFLLATITDMKIDSLDFKGADNDAEPLVTSYKISQGTTESGDYRIFNLNQFSDYPKSPFISDIRFTDINFGTQASESITQFIQLPSNLTLEDIPKSINLVMPDNSITLTRIVNYDKEKNQVLCRVTLDIAKPVFTPEEYPTVKDFFKKLVDILNEPLVMKKKQ